MDFSSFEVCLWTKPESDQLQACMICLKRGQRNTILWIKAYGWMRFNRDTLSVFRWFKPLSHDRDLGCHWQRKFPSVFAAVVCLQLSIYHCCDVEKTAPVPHWLCHLLLSPNPQHICTHIHPSIHVSPTRFDIVSSLLPCASLHPSPLWSPQKRLIQEGWAGVSELLLLCPMRRFHSTFLLLCCFYGPDMLTVQVAQSDVIQLYQLHKACLFTSLKGHVQNFDLHCHSCSVFILTMDHRKPLDCLLTNH